MSHLSRRDFVRTSAVSLAALSARRVLGANDDIRLAFLGVRLRGTQLIGDFQELAGVRVVAICDADSEVMHEQEQRLAESFDRLVRHLRANEVDLAQTPLVLGPMLTLEASQERFTGDMSDAANARLARTYRPPFSLTEVL